MSIDEFIAKQTQRQLKKEKFSQKHNTTAWISVYPMPYKKLISLTPVELLGLRPDYNKIDWVNSC